MFREKKVNQFDDFSILQHTDKNPMSKKPVSPKSSKIDERLEVCISSIKTLMFIWLPISRPYILSVSTIMTSNFGLNYVFIFSVTARDASMVAKYSDVYSCVSFLFEYNIMTSHTIGILRVSFNFFFEEILKNINFYRFINILFLSWFDTLLLKNLIEKFMFSPGCHNTCRVKERHNSRHVHIYK